MWAIADRKRERAYLFNGPQLGFSIPELFVEFELHSPDQPNLRGVSAAGVPLVGIGHNGDVAWGFTSGLSDEDDLYVEKLTGAETYEFKGERARDGLPRRGLHLQHAGHRPARPDRRRRARRRARSPSGSAAPSTARSSTPATASRSRAATRSGTASSRRSSASTELNDAKTIDDVDEAMQQVTWNENVMAADSQRQHRLLAPGPAPAEAEALGRAPAVPRRRARPSGAACSPAARRRT